MDKRLEEVAEMIKKSIPNDQHRTFDGARLYMREYISATREGCNDYVEARFCEIKHILHEIKDDLRKIKEDIGLNGDDQG